MVKWKNKEKSNEWLDEDIIDKELMNEYWRTQEKQINMAVPKRKCMLQISDTLKMVMIIMLLLPMVTSQSVTGNFKFCLSNSNTIIDLHRSCSKLKELNYNTTNWHILEEVADEINGRAYYVL